MQSQQVVKLRRRPYVRALKALYLALNGGVFIEHRLIPLGRHEAYAHADTAKAQVGVILTVQEPILAA